MSAGGRKGHIAATMCPSELKWYTLFLKGVCAWMGDTVAQDYVYTIEVLVVLLEDCEQEWVQEDLNINLMILSACMLLLVSCLGGTRGFEIMWTNLAALRYDLNYCEQLRTTQRCPDQLLEDSKGMMGN
jgi:hypothetical protein